MANPHKGEVAFKAGDESYTLSFSANALCEIEAELGRTVDQIVAMFNTPESISLATLRVMFWKGLEDHHDGIGFDDAKRILKKITPAQMGELIGRAFVLAMPDPGPNPPQPDSPQAGTGPASSRTGATSA